MPGASRCRLIAFRASSPSTRQPPSFPRSTPRARTFSRMPSSGRRRDLVRGVLWMTGALLSFSAMSVSILRPGLESLHPAAFLVLGAAFGYAVSLTQTKALTATETTFAILLWMNVVQLPLAMLGSDPRSYFALGVADLVPIGAVALSGLASHFCLAQAFRRCDASLVVPLDFMRIPLIAVVGWWLYGEPLDAYVFLGAGLIVLGVLWNLRAEATRKTGIAK